MKRPSKPVKRSIIISEDAYLHDINEAMTPTNYFIFRRDFVHYFILDRNEAMFIQDLHNISCLDFVKKDNEGRFLCTVEFLWDYGLRWDRNIQLRLFKSLSNRGYLTIIRKGTPGKRYVQINWMLLMADLREMKQKDKKDIKLQSTSNDVSKSTSNDVSKPTSNDVSKNVDTNVSPNRSKKDSRSPALRDGDILSTVKSNQIISPKKRSIPPVCYEFTDQLRKILKSRTKLVPAIAASRDSCADWFRKLLNKLNQDAVRIKRLLAWYEKNISEIDEPTVADAKAFCNPTIFNWLERLMRQSGDEVVVNSHLYFETLIEKDKVVTRPSSEKPTRIYYKKKGTIHAYDVDDLIKQGKKLPPWHWVVSARKDEAWVTEGV
jgi:hypothetical protein